jgi:hypothetical protein
MPGFVLLVCASCDEGFACHLGVKRSPREYDTSSNRIVWLPLWGFGLRVCMKGANSTNGQMLESLAGRLSRQVSLRLHSQLSAHSRILRLIMWIVCANNSRVNF